MVARMRTYLALILAIAGCKSNDKASATSDKPAAAAKSVEAPPPPAVPCDGPEMAELQKQMNLANGIGVDYSDAKAAEATKATAAASINGKRYAFTGCAFSKQGNAAVSFAARRDKRDDDIECKMAGGEAAYGEFLSAASSFDIEKLRLDIVGTVKSFESHRGGMEYTLADCTIKAHE